MDRIPLFRDLPLLASGPRHSWDVFGRADDLGTANFLTPQAVADAAREAIVTGERLGVSLPLTEPDPPFFGRSAFRHTILALNSIVQDDIIDVFYPQGSSQWDGLRHRADPDHGFYAGATALQAGAGGDRLGVHAWARAGIVGRSVLVDVERYLRATSTGYDPVDHVIIDATLISAVLAHERVQLRAGDILLFRTGYLEAYRAADIEGRRAIRGVGRSAGLAADENMVEFLWDNRIAAVAADNPALEVLPRDESQPVLHARLIPMLGYLIGEFFDLAALARACADDGRYIGFLASVPLYLPGGVGTPANAVVIR